MRSLMFLDPAIICEAREQVTLRRHLGCSGCVHRGKFDTSEGRPACQRKMKPGRRGYCRRWEHDESHRPVM